MATKFTRRVKRGLAILQGAGTYAQRVETLILNRNRMGTPRAERWTGTQQKDLRACAAWLDEQAAKVGEAVPA